MARGRRIYTQEEMLEKIINDIATKEAEIKELKEQKKRIEMELREKRLLELDGLISQSGKTFDEIKELLLDKENIEVAS